MNRSQISLAVVLAGLILLAVVAFAPAPLLAAGADCTANPSTVMVGENIHIECSGFDPNTFVNSYVVEPTGFSEIGRYNYTVCMMGVNASSYGTSKTNEGGIAQFTWYTQDGKNTCPVGVSDGYANQLGKYTVVIQQLDGKGGIKYVGTVDVTITGNGKTYSGAWLATDGPGVSGGALTVYGAGFAANEYVNVWFTRPGDCSGLGWWYYTGVSAFDPYKWDGAGVYGQSSVKTDSAGAFTFTYALVDRDREAYPCLGTWHVTANALGSGVGAEAEFVINGKSVTETAHVWTLESSVPSIDQAYDAYHNGVAVTVYGSGFPAGSTVNCWLTRPDGTVYHGWDIANSSERFAGKVGADGTFGGIPITWTSARGFQGEQPGTWAVTCGTPDGKYVGIAQFLVYPLPLIDP